PVRSPAPRLRSIGYQMRIWSTRRAIELRLVSSSDRPGVRRDRECCATALQHPAATLWQTRVSPLARQQCLQVATLRRPTRRLVTGTSCARSERAAPALSVLRLTSSGKRTSLGRIARGAALPPRRTSRERPAPFACEAGLPGRRGARDHYERACIACEQRGLGSQPYATVEHDPVVCSPRCHILLTGRGYHSPGRAEFR